MRPSSSFRLYRWLAAVVAAGALVVVNLGCSGSPGRASGPDAAFDADTCGAFDADAHGACVDPFGLDAPADVAIGAGHGVFTYTARVDLTPMSNAIGAVTGSFSYTLTITSEISLSTMPLPGLPAIPGVYPSTATNRVDLRGGGSFHMTAPLYMEDLVEDVSVAVTSSQPAPAGDFSEKVRTVTGRDFTVPFVFNVPAGARNYTTSFLVTPVPVTHHWMDTVIDTQDCDLPKDVTPATVTKTYDAATGTVKTDVLSHCSLPSSMDEQKVDDLPPYITTPDAVGPLLAGSYDGTGVIDASTTGNATTCADAFALIFPGADGIWPAQEAAGSDDFGTCTGTFQAHLHVELPR